VGFDFVDVKACHWNLMHELLSARTRPGPLGGDYAGRTRLLRTIIERICALHPDRQVMVRLSVFDTLPFHMAPTGAGEPMEWSAGEYPHGFGVDPQEPLRWDLTEPCQLLRDLRDQGVTAVNVTCGSPYYNPHVQRPAIFPPSDGYPPPEDPLVGVARQIHATRACKQAVPDLVIVGTGYSYLQDFVAHVAQAVVRDGWVDAVGLGRMVLSYPELPADVLARGSLQRKRVCRTFSDCTTGPRIGLVSGCYPLDDYYKSLPEAQQLQHAKRAQSNEVI
jgi:2,4-dienoyl-CoA reductase-like NADH-dependent reductase (Old Yellow Enzyme family)